MNKTYKALLLILLFALVFIIIKITFVNKKTYEENNRPLYSEVPKGTFRNTETGETFTFIDGNGYLVSCQPDCRNAYFDIDSNGKIIQIRSTDDNPIIGKIFSSVINKDDSEIADYVVDYQIFDKKYQSTYKAELCLHFKGGGKQCYSPAQKDQQVIVTLDPTDETKIGYVTVFNKMLKAEVLNITNVDHRLMEQQ